MLQKRIAKLILNKPLRTPTAGLYKQLNWLSFTDRCKYHSAVLVYKTLNNMAPSYMTEVLAFSKNEKYNLRSSKRSDLVLKTRPHTNYLKDTFAYYSMTIWNHIPYDIRVSSTLQSFKYRCKHFLMDNT